MGGLRDLFNIGFRVTVPNPDAPAKSRWAIERLSIFSWGFPLRRTGQLQRAHHVIRHT